MNNNKNILICYNINNTNLFLQYINTINDIVSNYNESIIKNEYYDNIIKNINKNDDIDDDIDDNIDDLLIYFITKSLKIKKRNIFLNFLLNYSFNFINNIYESLIKLINKFKIYNLSISGKINTYLKKMTEYFDNGGTDHHLIISKHIYLFKCSELII